MAVAEYQLPRNMPFVPKILSLGKIQVLASFPRRDTELTSLDGGGIRGISSLQILEVLMQNIRDAQDMPEVPRPCDVFDIIGGTSTGG